ncbi:MAG: M67 family metallopeptidase [Halofilum sp. (in: g-proteobacteria)]|nr:M67 family metallopeptidase [Halofilum sp. (in: g-proteobacteria)]
MAEAAAGTVHLSGPCRRRIRELAEAAWPHEACGLLEGHAIGRNAHVRRVLACRNEHERPAERYLIDPEAFLRADRAAGRAGRAIVGVWHSHPNGAAWFSQTDRAEAWPGWSYLVAAIERGRMCALQAWHVGTDVQAQRIVPR